jgi:ABC-type nitrate/sulfonate/bicarbonate transport system permease component
MIASEVLSQTQGSLGKAFQMAKINIQTERVFALALITIFLSFGLERFIKKVTV